VFACYGFVKSMRHQFQPSSPRIEMCVLAVQAQARAAKLQVSVGVISPYSRQVQLLRRRVEERGLLVGGMGYDVQRIGVLVEVHTVDGFQVL